MTPSPDMNNDTIFSLSSAAGRAGVAVFRISGPHSGDIVQQLTGHRCPPPRYAALRELFTRDGGLLDEALVLWMPGPHSFTGEDCAELHCHGSLAVGEALASAFQAAGGRQAAAGEFTRRAFDNGKMDLTEVEGLADLIDAETEAQRQQAVRQMGGGLKELYEAWRESLLDALAQIEGEIDFPDEADIPDALSHKAYPVISGVIENMSGVLADSHRGEHIRAGLDVAIIGAPNAGKSSLINKLARREAAITSEQPGTTRDIVEVQMVMAGLPVRLSDTAGLRDTGDDIEAEGVRRARERAENSDIRILVHDSGEAGWDLDGLSLLRAGDFIVCNKSELGRPSPLPAQLTGLPETQIFSLSAKSGAGLEEFISALEADVVQRFSPARDPGLTRVRHRDCVEKAYEALKRGRENLAFAPELSGDDIRAALHALEELAGRTDIESVFDRIFSRFCVGK